MNSNIKQLFLILLLIFPIFCWGQGKVTRNTSKHLNPSKKTIVTSGVENGYEWIDLGLPSGTKWAIHNIGATSPEGFGKYFAWGELSESTKNTYENYPNTTACKENTDYSGKENLDAATQIWGERWITPNLQNIQELLSCCKIEWSELNGYNGVTVTGPNGKTLFFPAAGMKTSDQYHWNPQLYGAYWVSTPSYTDTRYARMFLFEKSSYNPGINAHECWKAFATPIRPILKK